MAKIQDVANFFIEIGQAQAERGLGDPVTPLALEKLLYFAQGWYLAKYGKPLFEEDFEVWPHGPVVPAMYFKYKPYGSNGIMRDNSPCAANNFTQAEYELLLDVAQKYMKYSAWGLVDLSHEDGAPWDMTLQSQEKVISKDMIADYFLHHMGELQSFDDILDEYPIEV